MTSFNRATHVFIDRAAMTHNLQRVRELIPHAQVMAVIKADGYGHSMEEAAKALVNADEFGVSSLDDVERLRELSLNKPITLLSASLNADEYSLCARDNIRPTIYDWQQVDDLEHLVLTKPLNVWLKVDTGMGRLGFPTHEVPLVLARLKAANGVSEISLMTHLANADTPADPVNIKQLEEFAQIGKLDEFHQMSALNSAGIVGFSHHDYQMVRPGLMLYGISPQPEQSAQELGLRPAMSFHSELISVKQMSKGSSIGYGGTYELTKDSVIGIVACGYGDGYPRHAPSGTPVLVQGQKAELVGRVSMDMLAVDLKGIDAAVGQRVELWGRDNPIEQIASLASTIPYELTCSITGRVERIFV